MAEIWQTRDRLGREVVFTSAGRDHILRKHDDMADRLDEVHTVIEQPDYVTQDANDPYRQNHYRRTLSGRRFIKVVVDYRPVSAHGTWAGKVITAFFSGKRKRKEPLLWP